MLHTAITNAGGAKLRNTMHELGLMDTHTLVNGNRKGGYTLQGKHRNSEQRVFLPGAKTAVFRCVGQGTRSAASTSESSARRAAPQAATLCSPLSLSTHTPHTQTRERELKPTILPIPIPSMHAPHITHHTSHSTHLHLHLPYSHPPNATNSFQANIEMETQ